MAFAVADRVKETTTTTGTGTVSLAGAETGFQTFVSGVGSGNTTYYAIIDDSTGDYEVGVGTVTDATPDTLSRDTVFTSSNSDAKVDFQAGTKFVFVTQPADKAVYKDSGSDTVTIDKIQLANQSSHPTYSQGLLWYDTIHNTLNYYGDESDIVHEVGMEEHQKVYNNSGVTINKGEPMYFSGNFNDYPTVGKADATDVNKYNAQGLAGHDIENNSYGYLITAGLVENIDTSGLTAGQNFFVGLTAGAVQNASPAYPNYPMRLGWVVNSDASTGVLLVNQQNHSVTSFRVQTDTHIGGDMIIDGDLTVVGAQTIASSTNVETGAPFLYLNSGDTIGEANTTFTGSGLDDAYFAGHFSGTASTTYYVKIDATGTPDTFSWSKDNFSTTEATGVAITGGEQTLDNGIKIDFGATTGHTLNDVWSGTAAPLDVDTGIWSNRNTGGSGVGYTHVGLFFDVTDSKFKLVDEYDPEPTGSINTGDASYSAGTLVVDDIEGVDGTLSGALSVTGSITVGGTVDGRDVATDGTKLDGIESGATADQTAAEIKTAYESNSDTNAFTDTLLTKLNNIEANATADQTAADIRGLGFFDTSNDGSGSGLDADLLDGNHASAFATLSGSTFTGQVSVSSTSYPPLEVTRDAGSATTGNYGALKLNTSTTGTPAAGLGNYVGYFVDDVLKGSVGFENDGTFYVIDASDASLLTVDGSGNVGIGTDSPSDLLELSGSTAQPAIRFTDEDVAGLYHRVFTPTNTGLTISADTGNVAADSFVRFDVDGTERMRLDANGNVGIGVAPSEKLEVYGTTPRFQINDRGLYQAQLALIGNDLEIRGSSGQIEFYQGNADGASSTNQSMTLDASGNLLVGHTDYTTAVDNGSTGVTLGADGRLTASRANTVARFNREDSDGTITDFMKDGAVVGNIGIIGGDLYIASSDTGHEGLRFGNGAITPVDSAGASTDEGCNLGGATSRFNDLYLGGDSYITFTDNNTFSASTSSWHNIIVRNESENANNSCGIVFELNDTYHQNAGTGIAAVKANTSGDYGADLVIITRPESAAAVERMRVTNTGNVGIGTSSPEGLISFPATASNTPKFRLQSATSNVDVAISSYADANGTYASFGANNYLNSSGNDAAFDATKRSAYVFVDGRNLGAVTFGTAASGTASERMRLDASGNLLVGKTVTTLGTQGTLIASGQIQQTKSAGAPLLANRTGSGGTENGTIIDIRSNSTTVGSIGSVSGSVLDISTPSNYLSFRTDSDGDNEEVVWDSAQAGGTWRPGTDNLSDLGYSSRRWKDLYLSGVAYAESNVLAGGTSASSSGQVAVISSTSPFVSFHEGSTRKAYMQWVNSGYLQIRNEEGTDVRIRGNGDTELELADNAGSVHGRLKIYTASADFAMQHENGEQIVYGRKNQNTWLYYNGQWKIRTQANGIDIRNEEDAYSEIRMTTGANADTRGYFYANTSNQIGILDSGGSWAVKHINDQGTQFYTDGGTSNLRIGGDLVSGDYGTVQTDVYKAGWSGYSITGNWVFMGNGSANCGIYNDTDNEWMAYFVRNAEARLYYNGTETLRTVSGGIDVSGDIYVDDQIIHNGDTDTYMQFHAADQWRVVTGGSERLEVNNSGITASVDITVNSDERIKDNIEQIPDALEKVQAIRGVTFTRTDTEDDTRHAGVIAQEVEKVLPEVVTENAETGIKSVAYANMVGLLIEAIKEQQTQIDDLKNEVIRLKGY